MYYTKLCKSKSSPIFIKDIQALEESLLKIKVPHFINRKPRSLKEISSDQSMGKPYVIRFFSNKISKA